MPWPPHFLCEIKNPESSSIRHSFLTTVNPLLSPGGGAYLFQTHLRGGLIETGGLFNLAKTMVSQSP